MVDAMSDQQQQYQSNFITRSEYEQFVKVYEIRHSELRLENKEMETEIKAQMAALNSKLDALSVQMLSRGNDAWKLLATSMVSLVIGYLASYLQHLIVH